MEFIDLTAAQEAYDTYRTSHAHDGAFACCTAHAVADDVPALIAEIRRLRTALANRKDIP